MYRRLVVIVGKELPSTGYRCGKLTYVVKTLENIVIGKTVDDQIWTELLEELSSTLLNIGSECRSYDAVCSKRKQSRAIAFLKQ